VSEPERIEQLSLIPEDSPPDTPEFLRLQDRVQAQQRRIRDLEMALDQSLASLSELRSQIVDQSFLERQLASTEEIANVQQQAIHQLKLQFAQQKAELEAKAQQAQQREREYQALLDAAEIRQQAELDVLKAQFGDRIEGQPSAIEQQIQVLQADLQLRRQQFQDLEAQKQAAQIRITELETQVETLEGRIARHMTTQALLQQVCQELESDREQSQNRITELESQSAEMQEQILSQAQQASEYETAVQHWKTRYQVLQEKAIVLKQFLSTQDLPSEIVELLATIETSAPPDLKSTARSNPFNQDLKIDIPEFLVRRRTYRSRKSKEA
jgi:chromosome segregation ATPase